MAVKKITLENLLINKSAQFFLIKKKITKKFFNSIFLEITKNKKGSLVLKKIREPYDNIKISIVVFKKEDEPLFTTNSGLLDEKYVYLLALEIKDTLVINKLNVMLPNKHISGYLEEYNYENFCYFMGNENPTYENIKMRNMSLSNNVISSRSLEASSLNRLIPFTSTKRHIPSGFRLLTEKGRYSLTPSSSRITQSSSRSAIDDFINWASDTVTELKSEFHSCFLENFARPTTLKYLKQLGLNATVIFFELSELEQEVHAGNVVLYKSNDELFTQKENEVFFNFFRLPFVIKNNQIFCKGIKLSGCIRLGDKYATVRSTGLNKIVIKRKDGDASMFSKFLNKEKPFAITFSSPKYSYFSKSCFEDSLVDKNIDMILSVINDSCNFSDICDEKRKDGININTDRFPHGSVFRAVEDYYRDNDCIVICDDMNDEWADHIVIDNNNHPPQLTFVHSKYAKKSQYGASAFHEVVSQALKNLAHIYDETSSFKSKYVSKWDKNYEKSNISRVLGATSWESIEEKLNDINSNFNSVRSVVLATPFIKKSVLREKLSKDKIDYYHVQLIWLIGAFVSTCREYGVKPVILAKK